MTLHVFNIFTTVYLNIPGSQLNKLFEKLFEFSIENKNLTFGNIRGPVIEDI